MNCIEIYESIYKRPPADVAFCPYRVCPVGAHVDHNKGKITGLALNKGIQIAYSPKMNGVVELMSLQFSKRAQWHVTAVPEVKENDWADQLRGATLMLSRKYPLHIGLCGVVEGSLPIGGLSSSAAVILAFLCALCKVNKLIIPDQELILIAQAAENKYVGVSCGLLDQCCEVFSRKDHLLFLDTENLQYELIPTPKNMKPYKIAIFFSGLERSLAGSKYNMRVDECRSAAYALKAFSGMEYGKIQETTLRDVPYEVYLQYKDRLPQPWAKRAEHFYTEMQRVEQSVDAWCRGDIEAYGRLSFESGKSSICNYETGSPELQAMYEIMTQTDGIYGGRFSGAGFKGCSMALIDSAFEESIVEKVTAEYLKRFPEMEGKYSVHICESADGVGSQMGE